MDLKPLSPVTIDRERTKLGKRGELRWLHVRQLVVDPRYQRAVGLKGTDNIKKIAKEFSWSFFSPVIVSPRKSGQYAIIDGQHRATAAVSRGDIEEIPCLVLAATPEEEAMAFAKINGTVTKVSPLAIFRAEFMAAKPDVMRLTEIVFRADVVILGYPKTKDKMLVGETMSVVSIKDCLRKFGEKVLVAALRTITKTGNGNPGMLKEEVISGTCDILSNHPHWWVDEPKLLATVNAVGIVELHRRASIAKGAAGKGSYREHYASAFLSAVAPAFKPTQVAVGVHAPLASLPTLQKPVNHDRALIEAALAAGKVRRFDTSDSSEFWVLAEYMLHRTGKEYKLLKRKPSLDGRILDWDKFYELVNRERVKEKKPPITPKQGAK